MGANKEVKHLAKHDELVGAALAHWNAIINFTKEVEKQAKKSMKRGECLTYFTPNFRHDLKDMQVCIVQLCSILDRIHALEKKS